MNVIFNSYGGKGHSGGSKDPARRSDELHQGGDRSTRDGSSGTQLFNFPQPTPTFITLFYFVPLGTSPGSKISVIKVFLIEFIRCSTLLALNSQ